jgi:hypothetical protein
MKFKTESVLAVNSQVITAGLKLSRVADGQQRLQIVSYLVANVFLA